MRKYSVLATGGTDQDLHHDRQPHDPIGFPNAVVPPWLAGISTRSPTRASAREQNQVSLLNRRHNLRQKARETQWLGMQERQALLIRRTQQYAICTRGHHTLCRYQEPWKHSQMADTNSALWCATESRWFRHLGSSGYSVMSPLCRFPCSVTGLSMPAKAPSGPNFCREPSMRVIASIMNPRRPTAMLDIVC